jgi:triosephosphate isomerase
MVTSNKRRKIVAANWKMNGNLLLATSIAEKLEAVAPDLSADVVICPSFPYLFALNSIVELAPCYLGAQNMSEFEQGAYTGEVSASMLKEMCCEYVILGHSERRSLFNESSHHVAKKVKTAIAHGLTVILCIGESESERLAEQTETVLASQIQPVIDEIGIDAFKQLVIAYEPVWAIGTGKTASAEMAQETHQYIRSFIAKHDQQIAEQIAILYGGSVNAENCESLFAQPDIDGGLIGGASLNVDEFLTICLSAKGH